MRGLDRANEVAAPQSAQGRARAGAATAGQMTDETDTRLQPLRSNRGGAVRGLDRANAVAGTNGLKGRTNAAARQATSGRTTGIVQAPARATVGSTQRGLDRANIAAGTNGLKGRTNAVTRQTTGRVTDEVDQVETGSVPTRSNRGGLVRGLDRADAVAGPNGLQGRTNARTRQLTVD